MAERCLGHKLHGVEGTYDRHDYFKERRAALDQWTDVFVRAERGKAPSRHFLDIRGIPIGPADAPAASVPAVSKVAVPTTEHVTLAIFNGKAPRQLHTSTLINI